MGWWLAGALFYLGTAVVFYGTLVATAQPEPMRRELQYAGRDAWRKAA